MDQATLTITLVPSGQDSIGSRTLVLGPSNYHSVVGRSSKIPTKNILPAKDNGWFDNRVMSRDHAEFLALPKFQEVYVMDTNSMHGTWVNGKKLTSGRKTLLEDGDVLIFGAEVSRASESYKPVEVRLQLAWGDDKVPTPQASANPPRSVNSFVVPDDDDDEEGEDEDEQMEEEDDDVVEVPSPVAAKEKPPSQPPCVVTFESDDEVEETTHMEVTAEEKPVTAGEQATQEFPQRLAGIRLAAEAVAKQNAERALNEFRKHFEERKRAEQENDAPEHDSPSEHADSGASANGSDRDSSSEPSPPPSDSEAEAEGEDDAVNEDEPAESEEPHQPIKVPQSVFTNMGVNAPFPALATAPEQRPPNPLRTIPNVGPITAKFRRNRPHNDGPGVAQYPHWDGSIGSRNHVPPPNVVPPKDLPGETEAIQYQRADGSIAGGVLRYNRTDGGLGVNTKNTVSAANGRPWPFELPPPPGVSPYMDGPFCNPREFGFQDPLQAPPPPPPPPMPLFNMGAPFPPQEQKTNQPQADFTPNLFCPGPAGGYIPRNRDELLQARLDSLLDRMDAAKGVEKITGQASVNANANVRPGTLSVSRSDPRAIIQEPGDSALKRKRDAEEEEASAGAWRKMAVKRAAMLAKEVEDAIEKRAAEPTPAPVESGEHSYPMYFLHEERTVEDAPVSEPDAAAEAEVEEPETETRSPKRVKTAHYPATIRSTVARYAATAVMGAVIGGVGTVMALASLPTGFFE